MLERISVNGLTDLFRTWRGDGAFIQMEINAFLLEVETTILQNPVNVGR
jgi:hypothetical protein